MGNIKIHTSVSEIDPSQWNDLIKNAHSGEISFFQTKECYDFYASLSFLSPFIFGISENDKLVALAWGYLTAEGGRMKRFFSRRAIVPGGILMRAGISGDTLSVFLNYVGRQLSEQAIYIEIRNHFDYKSYQPYFEASGFEYHPHLNYLIALTEPNEVFGRFNKSRQRQIKQAVASGVTWSVTLQKKDIDAFYTLLQHTYRAKARRPLFPVEYFYKLVQQPEGRLLVVKKDDTVVGGMACFQYAGNRLYELFICGDDSRKELYPSVMATWAGIDYAIQQQVAVFDFMGAGKPEAFYGVREFKNRFGGDLVEYGRFLYIGKPLLYAIGRFYIEKLSRVFSK